MARTKTRADGLIERTRTINGKRMHFYGRTAQEVRAKMDAAIVEASTKASKGDRFEDVAAAFWKDKEPRLKYGSRRGYRHKVEVAIDWFSGYGMREIRASDISRELSRMASQGYSYKVISGQKSVLSMIWQYWCAQMDGDLNPVALLKLPQGLPQKKRRAPTEEEIRLVKAHPGGFGLCAAIMMYSGLRLGEVMALQIQDLEHGRIQVSKAVVWHGNAPEIETPKTENAVRTVPILDPLKPLLAERTAGHSGEEYLFGGNTPLTKSAYENAWLQYCLSIGCAHDTGRKYKTGKKDKKGNPLYKSVMAADFTAHQLRHEFASTLVDCGISPQVAKDLMGHADILTTQRWYAEAKGSAIREAEKELNRYLSRNTVADA